MKPPPPATTMRSFFCTIDITSSLYGFALVRARFCNRAPRNPSETRHERCPRSRALTSSYRRVSVDSRRAGGHRSSRARVPRMHVLLLNQAFYPDIVSTAQMGRDLADALVRRGHKVTAVASRSIYGKKGAVLPKAETIDGIDIRRVGASFFGKTGYAARATDFALFYLLAAGKVLTGPRPDVVVSYTTPP